jgi:hypothetical protein
MPSIASTPRQINQTPRAPQSDHDRVFALAAADYRAALCGFAAGRVTWDELVTAYRRLAVAWRAQ